MLSLLPSFLRGAIGLACLALNTLFWCTPLFVLALVKLALPLRAVRVRVDPLLNAIAGHWIAGNGRWTDLVTRIEWDVQGVESLQADTWYLVNCNHQSWVDILVLQRVLNRRIPLLKFFLKQQLIWVPVIGLAWWALDFPFMRRHSKSALRADPSRRDDDRRATLRACAKFALVPTSVMNFAEGTRYTEVKHAAQGSPYRHLLKPRAGALAMTLNAMGGQFRSLIDATIVYPDGPPTFWEFASGKVRRVVVRVHELPIPEDFCSGRYAEDAAFRRRFNEWLNALWTAKDGQIDALLAAG
jgi:1-acyl-sn-glycerol-3-phosphate acyltransferase